MDDLRTAAGAIDSSELPSSNEVVPLLGALIAYTEHGDKLFKAAGSENATADVSALLSDAPKDDAGTAADSAKQAKK
jgi:hypothetical protein